jgi:hypothetical protein
MELLRCQTTCFEFYDEVVVVNLLQAAAHLHQKGQHQLLTL